MSLWKFFKRKTDEELFDRAVNEKNHTMTIVYGSRLLAKKKLESRRLISYTESLFKLNRKKEAVKILDKYAQEKLENGYFSEAISMLKKAMKFNPECIQTARLLSRAYESKNLLFEAFNVLINLFLTLKDANKNTADAQRLIDSFLKRHPVPSFLEAYDIRIAAG